MLLPVVQLLEQGAQQHLPAGAGKAFCHALKYD
jgi:hypothetical protein